MEESKYKKGDRVHCINEIQPATICNISHDQMGYYYDIQYYTAGIVHRVPESGLLPFVKNLE